MLVSKRGSEDLGEEEEVGEIGDIDDLLGELDDFLGEIESLVGVRELVGETEVIGSIV
jgi:hypothetical protein